MVRIFYFSFFPSQTSNSPEKTPILYELKMKFMEFVIVSVCTQICDKNILHLEFVKICPSQLHLNNCQEIAHA